MISCHKLLSLQISRPSFPSVRYLACCIRHTRHNCSGVLTLGIWYHVIPYDTYDMVPVSHYEGISYHMILVEGNRLQEMKLNLNTNPKIHAFTLHHGRLVLFLPRLSDAQSRGVQLNPFHAVAKRTPVRQVGVDLPNGLRAEV